MLELTKAYWRWTLALWYGAAWFLLALSPMLAVLLAISWFAAPSCIK
jgi:hypothetical protein